MNVTSQPALRSHFAAPDARDPREAAAALPRAALPGVEQAAAYRWEYWRHTLAGLLRPHGLRLPDSRAHGGSFTLGAGLRQHWHELYDMQPAADGAAEGAFLFGQGPMLLLQLRVFADLGVNLRHVQLVRNSVVHPVGQERYLAARRQHLECRLLRTVRAGVHEVLLVLGTTIRDGEDRIVARVEDSFLVRRLPAADAAQAAVDPEVRRVLSRLHLRTRELDAGQPGSRGRTLFIGTDVAQRFGRVAGDLDPRHTSRLAARLTGHRRPSVQRMYLRNLVARELAEWGLPVLRLSITFTAKVRPGQTLVLVQQGERFELSDPRGALVAFGRC